MKAKDKADLLIKQADLIYKKLLIFLAVAGSSWVYGVQKSAYDRIVCTSSVIIFVITALAIVWNLMKYGEIQKNIKEILWD